MASTSLLDHEVCDLLGQAESRLRDNAAASHQPRRYVNVPERPGSLPQTIPHPYIHNIGGQAVISEKDPVHSSSQSLRVTKSRDKTTAGGEAWHHIPRTELSPEIKRDFQLLKMRGVLDPKRHYKREVSHRCAPKYSHVGTVVQGSTEYSNARIPLKSRKSTFLAEILAQEAEEGRFKRKYQDIQASRSSGKKAHYKNLKAKR